MCLEAILWGGLKINLFYFLRCNHMEKNAKIFKKNPHADGMGGLVRT